MSTFERGAILSPVQFNNPGSAYFRMDEQLLPNIPACLLYWDKIIAPILLRGIAPRYENEIGALEGMGVAESFVLVEGTTFSGDDLPELHQIMRQRMSGYRSDDKQTWSYVLPPGAGDPALAPLLEGAGPLRNASLLQVSLRVNLPVPLRDVPYDDIRRFRESRKDELIALGNAIDDIITTCANDPNEQTAIARAGEKLQRQLSEVRKVYSERWTSGLVKRFTNSFVKEGAAALSAALALGVPLSHAITVQAATASAKTIFEPPARGPYAVAIEAESL